MELSGRLRAVADMVTEGARVADIGCDHGYTSIYLWKERKCPRVIAMDVRKGPLERAKASIDKYDLSDYIEVRLSDGTEALQENEADTLLLSGMGGRLTISILERTYERLGRAFDLILQPQSEIFLVRAFLRKEGIRIIDETMVLDQGKFYTVIKAQPGKDGKKRDGDDKEAPEKKKLRRDGKEDDKEGGSYPQIVGDYFGPVLLAKRPETFLLFLEKEREKTHKLLSEVTKEERRKELREYLSYVERAMHGQERI